MDQPEPTILRQLFPTIKALIADKSPLGQIKLIQALHQLLTLSVICALTSGCRKPEDFANAAGDCFSDVANWLFEKPKPTTATDADARMTLSKEEFDKMMGD